MDHSEVVKTYPPRGPLQQCRLRSSTEFNCFRCGQQKTSKLITVFGDDSRHLLCNGCYGFLLSVFEIKAGEAETTDKAQSLAVLLLKLVPASEAEARLLQLSQTEPRLGQLHPLAKRFLASAEYVAAQLRNATGLDWSPAVIGLCKTCEVQLIDRLIEPLADRLRGLDLSEDCADPDLGRVARYCARRTDVAPELGAIRHLLQTAANSKARRETSVILKALTSQWPLSAWLLQANGALDLLLRLTQEFRNPAAHIDQLDESHYTSARHLVLGEDGLLLRIYESTTAAR